MTDLVRPPRLHFLAVLAVGSLGVYVGRFIGFNSWDALLHPDGDSEPLPALLRPGMRLTIAFDDISLPLPPMQAPDIRQRVIEAVLLVTALARAS